MSLSQDNELAQKVYFLALRAQEWCPFGLVIADRDSIIVQVNKATEDLFDYQRTQLIGQRLDILMPEDRRAAHALHWERFRRDPRPRFMGKGMKLPGRRKNGAEFNIEIQIAAERTPPDDWFAFAYIRSLEFEPNILASKPDAL